MKPIISPWIVYLAHLFSGINALFNVLLWGSVIVLFVGFVSEFELFEFVTDEIDKFVKILIIIISISSIGLIAIPDKETVYTMIVLDQLTEDNINLIGETGKDVIDYVTDKVEVILDKEKDDE